MAQMPKKTKKEVINDFTETEFDISKSTEVSLKDNISTSHGCFKNPESSLKQPGVRSTHYTSL